MTWHQTTIVGNLGGDPELRYQPNGDPVCNFNVAVNIRRRDRQSGNWYDDTVWYRVAVWGNQAENCNTYLAKGRKVLAVGTVSANPYINNSGEAAASLNLSARDVRFLSGRGDGDQGGGGWQGGGQRGGQRSSAPALGSGESQRGDRASNYPDSPSTIEDIPF